MSLSDEQCSYPMIHEEVVQKVIPQMLASDVTYTLAEFFKVFGDATRLRILDALSCSEMCVCDLAACLNMTHSAISHQLRVLKASKLVKARKQGKVVYYTLADDHIAAILHTGLEHIHE